MKHLSYTRAPSQISIGLLAHFQSEIILFVAFFQGAFEARQPAVDQVRDPAAEIRREIVPQQEMPADPLEMAQRFMRVRLRELDPTYLELSTLIEAIDRRTSAECNEFGVLLRVMSNNQILGIDER